MAHDDEREKPARNDRRRQGRRARLILVIGVVCASVAVATRLWWLDAGRNQFFPKKWDVVEEGRIYRSGLIDRRLIEGALRDHHIATVVDLSGKGPEDPDVAAEGEAARRLGVRVVNLPGLHGDGTGDALAYVTAVQEMTRATVGHAVLVHCASGSERTGVAVALYRMLLEGWDGSRSWDEYRRYRHDPPKDVHLAQYVKENLGTVAQRLVAAGVLEKVPEPLPVFGPRAAGP